MIFLYWYSWEPGASREPVSCPLSLSVPRYDDHVIVPEYCDPNGATDNQAGYSPPRVGTLRLKYTIPYHIKVYASLTQILLNWKWFRILAWIPPSNLHFTKSFQVCLSVRNSNCGHDDAGTNFWKHERPDRQFLVSLNCDINSHGTPKVANFLAVSWYIFC